MDTSVRIDSREKLINELGDLLEMANSEITPYINLTAQILGERVDSAYTDIDDEEELKGHEIVDIEIVSSHEAFSVMQRFAVSRADKECDILLRALSKRHPFSTFRTSVECLDILQEWYKFKREAYRELANDRLLSAGIVFEDGKIVLNPSACSQDTDLDEEPNDL